MPVDAGNWTLGFVLGAIVVAVVVVVVVTIIALATRIRNQVRTVIADLERARDHTAPLWDVRATNVVAADLRDRLVAFGGGDGRESEGAR